MIMEVRNGQIFIVIGIIFSVSKGTKIDTNDEVKQTKIDINDEMRHTNIDTNDEMRQIKEQLRIVMHANENLQLSMELLQSKVLSLEGSNKVLKAEYEVIRNTNDKLHESIKLLMETNRQQNNKDEQCLSVSTCLKELYNGAKYYSLAKEVGEQEKVLHEDSLNDAPENFMVNKINIVKRLLLASDVTTPAPPHRIAFFARVSGAIGHLGDNQIIPMKMEVIDTASAFHADSGIFEAPLGGLFAFFVTITSYIDNIEYEVVKNGVAVAFGISQNQASKWASSSVSSLIQLSVGDHVYVRIHGSGHADKGEMIGSYSHFMGFSLE